MWRPKARNSPRWRRSGRTSPPASRDRIRTESQAEGAMPTYDPNNIFAKILRGELPAYKVYEDDGAVAFLDIMPRSPGHTLILPKASARNILDIGAEDLAHVMMTAQ